MKKLLPVICVLFFLTNTASAQAPANDECTDAVEITLDINTCSNTINGTTQNATQSSTAPTPSCDFTGGAYDDDVWYKFTAAQSGIVKLQFSNITGGTENAYLSCAINSGTDCNTLSETFCTWTVQNLSPIHVTQGTTYYIRLFSSLNDPAEYKSFSFCAYLISNDECSTAKELTVGDINNYQSFSQYGTTDGGTESSTTPLPSCAADGINDDVWYKFTATSTGNTHIRFANITFNSIAVQAYEGNCNGLSLLDNNCVTTSTNTGYVNINAVAGNTYYIRVFTTDPTPALHSDFYIYAYTLTPAPANDDCDNATEIILGDGACSSFTNGTTLGATQSSNTPAPTCDAAGSDDDIWFKFTSTENRPVRFEIQNNYTNGNNSGITVQVYSGSCTVLTTESCNSFTGYTFGSNFAFQINAAASTDYYVRVFTTENNPTKFANVNICAFYLPPPPANDECTDAVVLTPGTTSQCSNPTAGTTIGATASGQSACFGANADDDVWYKFAATSANHIISVTPATVNGIQQYTAFQVFSGDCGTLTELNCVTSNTADGPAQQVITNLTIGETYYVRVYSLNDDYTYKGDFNICLTTPNDDCFHAEELTINPASSCDVVTNGNTLFGAYGGNADCTSQTFLYIDDAVWYKFTATSTSQKVTVTPAATAGADDIAFQFLDGADCNSLNITACINNTTGNNAEENTFTGLVIGNTYYLKVYSQENSSIIRGAFSVCLSSNNNDECETAATVPVNLHTTCDEVITGTTTGTTQSLSGACVGFNDDDVWYKFTAISGTQKITVTPAETNGIDDIVLETFYNDCSSLASSACVNNTVGNSAEEKFLTGLVPGSVYYFRVYSARFSSGNGDFSVCITSYTDNCYYVDTLIANADENCAIQTAGSTIVTGSINDPGCAGDADDNSWYLFQATATNHIIKVTPSATNGIDDAVIEVFYGACGAMSSIACGNSTSGNAVEEAVLTGLNIGSWYYARVYSNATAAGEGSYDICVTTSTEPPANDECTNPIVINGAVSPTSICNILIRGANYFATGSGLLNCNSQAVNDDVWYSFVALSTTQRIGVTTVGFPNGVNNPYVQAFSGSCNSLTPLGCSFLNSTLIISTIPGNVYYVRVYGDGTNQGEFNLCITTPYAFNDDCLGAITASVNNDNTCTVTTSSTTVNSTSSGQFGGCTAGAADDDVWLKFTATAGAHNITVTPDATGGINDVVMEVYGGSCSALSYFTCANNTTGSAAESLVAQGLTPGNTYFIRVYSAGNGAGNSGAFAVCINSTVANDECTGALTIPVNNDGSCTNTFAGTNVGSSSSNDIPFCNGVGTGYGSYNVWYKFTANQTAYNISVTPTTTGGIVNARWQLMSGSCGNLVSLGCIASPFTFENLVPGNTYYLLVYSDNGNTASLGAFNICVKSILLANDICSGAVDVPVSNNVTCVTSVTGTTSGAFNSFSNGIKDVWYKFIATETAHKIKVSPVADSIRNVAFEVYQGNCTALSSIAQVNNYPSFSNADTTKAEIQSVENLTIGNTYYVRVYSGGVFRSSNIVDIGGSFNICVSLSANDVCTKAIEIPVNADGDCNAVILDSLDLATVTYGANYCSDISNVNKDVWFKFIALDTLQLVTVNWAGLQLFSGNCGALTPMRCGGPREIFGGLIVGNTYYVRAFTNMNAVSAKFSVCISKGAINNECGGAITLPVNTNPGCTLITNGSTRSSTASTNTTCNNYNNNFYTFSFNNPPLAQFGNDVWYKFVATSTQHKVTITGITTNMNLFLSIYSGGCNSLSPIVCINDYKPLPGSADEEAVALDNLTIGNTYYVRVYNQANIFDGADFTICITDIDPINDLCSNAITVPVNSGDNCTQTVTGSNVTATRSYDAAFINSHYISSGNCPAFANADVFYKFIATANTLKLTVTPTLSGGIDDIMFQVYTGNCGSFSPIAWADFTSSNRAEITRLENLIIGNTYYLRISNASGERSARGSFTICINEPPLNDVCSGAVTLDVNANTTCTLQTAGTTVAASPINGNEDVWYKFIATASEHRITVTAGSLPNPVFALYKGDCNNLVQIREDIDYDAAGSNIEFQAYDSLTIGNTYYIRVWSLPPTFGSCPKYANVNITGTFSICVSAPAMPNDLIDGATTLLVNSGSSCANSLTTGNIGSTYSYNHKDCYNPTNYYQREYVSDVWFKFTATATSHIISVTPEASSGIKNPAFAVYERLTPNNGDNLLSRGCVNFADNNAGETQSFNGLVPGNTYYIRVMSDIHTANQGNFNICITTHPLPAYTSKIITYAGDGTGEGISATNSKLFSPTDVTTDNKGNVYIADSGRIKKISLADGTVTIVAGTGVPGTSGDNGPASAAQIPLKVKIAVDNSGNIFIADYEGIADHIDTANVSKYGTVRKVNASTGIISKIIDMPIDLVQIINNLPTIYIYKSRQITGIITDAAGNVFITVNWAKHYNVYKQTPGGAFSELFMGDHFGYGLGIDGSGNLYVATAEGLSPCVVINGSIGPCFDGTPAYYETRHIRKIIPGAGSSIIAGKGLTGVLIGAAPFGYTGDGGPAVDAQLKPIDVKVDAAGNVYIADGYGYGNGAEYGGNYAIRKINTAGIITTIAGTGVNTYSGDGGPASLAAIRTPLSIAVDSSGNIYVADVKENESPVTAGNRIRKIIANCSGGIAMSNKGNTFYVTGEKTIYKECDTIAKVFPVSPAVFNKDVTAKVWIEPAVPLFSSQPYVARHYEVNPLTDPSAATTRLTLYFTQTEFDNYNAQVGPGSKLPLEATDAANYKPRLVVIQREGVSADGSGLQATYSGAVTTINPNDNDISWNSSQNRWEITFTVTGGGGFFVQTIPDCPVNTWTSAANNGNWNDASNWCNGVVPTGATDAIIPTGATPYPSLNTNVAINNLEIKAGATVSIGSNTFTVNAAITGTGTLSGSPSSSIITNASTTLLFTPGSNTIKDITVNAGTIILGNALNITAGTALPNSTGTVTVIQGAVLASNGNLTFKSNEFGTARLAQGSDAGNFVTGNATVERYIPNNNFRSWRLLSVPTHSSGQTIRQAWQEGDANPSPQQNNLAGYGTQITGTGSLVTAQAAGFDNTAANAAMLFWNVNAWSPVTNTNTAIDNKKAYFLYVRGERSKGVSGAVSNSSATTLRTAGLLYTGNQSTTVPANSFTVVPNLYASAIDFTGLTRTGVNNLFYIWDSKKLNGSSLGVYQTFSSTNSFNCMVSGGSYTLGQPNTLIESGQAFFVTGNSSGGSIIQHESSKRNGSTGLGFRPSPSSIIKLDTRLYDADGTTMRDANTIVFDAGYTNKIDEEDAPKIGNPGENFALENDSKILAIEGRQPLKDVDVVQFRMWNLKQQQYKLELVTLNMNTDGLTAVLEDSYLKTSTPVDLATATTVIFVVDGNAGSSAANRFRIVFSKAKTVVNDTKQGYTIAPNPVESGIVNVQFKNQPGGKYNIRITSTTGVVVASKVILHTGGNATQTINLPMAIVSGNYKVEIITTGKSPEVISMMVNRK